MTRATLFIYRDYSTPTNWFWELVVPRMSPLSCDTAYRSRGEAETKCLFALSMLMLHLNKLANDLQL